MSVRKVLLNSVWFGVVPKISTFVNVILLPIITPYLTTSDFGIWGVITGYVGIFTSISSLGLYVHLTNTYYEYEEKFRLMWSRLLYLILLASVISSLFLFFILFFSLSNLPIKVRILATSLAVLPVLFSGNQLLAEHLYTLRGTPKQLVIRNLIASFAGILVSYILICYFQLGYLGFVYGAALNSLLAFILFIHPLWIVEKILPTVEKKLKRTKYLLKISIPAIPHALGFIFLSSSARIVMDWYNVSLEDIGLFTNGYNIGAYINIITGATVTAIVPNIQTAYRNQNFNNYKYLYFFCQFLTVVSILVFVIWMPELYDLLIRNDELKKSIEISQLSCFANAVFPFYVFLSTISFIERRTGQLLWLVFFPGLLNVLLCIVFIPMFGYKTAVYTTIISYWSQLLIPFFVKFYHDYTKKWLKNMGIILLILFILLICMVVSTALAQLSIILKLIISSGLSIMTIVLLKKLSSRSIF